MYSQNSQPKFTRNLLISAGLLFLLALTFEVYVWSQLQVNHANELRYRSYLLADELRHSGDDLTRMIRTYASTGNPVFKQHFMDILDIRDGRKPRPENYSRPYWDLVLGSGQSARPTQPAIPLLELMRQTGVTEEEFQKLAQAKANSDALTIPEIEAMKLVESSGPEAEANRAKAVRLLFDDKYHEAKFGVMKPIDDFMAMVDQRTLTSVQTASTHARTLLYLFVAIGLALMFMLWRTYAALRDTLGGSLSEVSNQIALIGSGDYSSGHTLKEGLGNSVLGWLAQTQEKLDENDRKRKQADAASHAEAIEREQAQEALALRAEELAQFNAAAVGRELRMIELKQQVNGLAAQLGQPQPYAMESLNEVVQSAAQHAASRITGHPKSQTADPGGDA